MSDTSEIDDDSVSVDSELFSTTCEKFCWICNEIQSPSDLISQSFNVHGIPCTDEEKSNILRIICGLLHVKYDLLHYLNVELPFCSSCLTIILQLIGLREKLVQLETEIVDKIKSLESTITQTQLEAILSIKSDNSRRIFRKQAIKEYRTKELLRRKICEFNIKNEHIIEIEPSFVQLHLGMSMLRQTTPNSEQSNHHNSNAQNQVLNNEECEDWIENQNGPLTRSKIRIKEEPVDTSGTGVEVSQFEVEDDFLTDDVKDEPEEEEGKDSDSDFDAGDPDDDEDSDFEVRRRPRTRGSLCRNQLISKNDKSDNTPKLRRSTEEFSEMEIRSDGRRFFEGIEIIWRDGSNEIGRGGYILKCGNCPKEVDQKTAQRHQKCAYRLMQVHIKGQHLGAYKCEICGKNLSQLRQLRIHIESRHPPGGKKNKLRKARVFGTEKFPPEVSVEQDGRVLYQNIEIIRIDHENEDDFDVECGAGCGKVLNCATARRNKQCPYRQMVNHIKGAHIGAYSCEACGKTFLNSKSLRKHMKSKHSDHPPDLKCDICGRPIATPRYLKKHQWSHKSQEEKNIALAAGEKEPETYAAIIQKRRARGTSFQCSECGKTFHFLSNLKRHEHVHKTEKNHQCTQCGKFYGTAENLNTHVKYIHETERVHKKYRCRFCEKCFTTKSPWMKHERTHTKDIPYFCPTCNKGFALKQSLNNHIKTKKCVNGEPIKNPRPRKERKPKRNAEEREEINRENENRNQIINIPPNVYNHGREHQGISNIPGISSAIPNFQFPHYPRPFEQQFLQQHYDSYM